jgi:hypothetical protein
VRGKSRPGSANARDRTHELVPVPEAQREEVIELGKPVVRDSGVMPLSSLSGAFSHFGMLGDFVRD